MSDSRSTEKPPDAFSMDTELKRDLGPISATTVIIGTIIGSGIFAGPAIVARYTDSSGLTLMVWVICGLMSFCGAVSYAELGGIMPSKKLDFRISSFMTFDTPLQAIWQCLADLQASWRQYWATRVCQWSRAMHTLANNTLRLCSGEWRISI